MRASPDGARLLIRTAVGAMLAGDAVALLDVATGVQTPLAPADPAEGAISDATFSPDGDRVLFTTITGSVAVLDIATGDVGAVADLGGLPPATTADSLQWATDDTAFVQTGDATCERIALLAA